MLTIKAIKKDGSEKLISKIFSSKMFGFIREHFNNEKINIIDDSSSLELITSDLVEKKEDLTTIELTFKKTITINNLDIEDRQEIDRIISEIKNFCNQSVNINNYVYLPLNMREKKNGNNRTSTPGNRL
jgi:hypothetical protein